MATRFDQIGSAQNVQQVGQGEAYVQDKYENPLLGVGKMTASLAQANRKAEIAAAKANQEKLKMNDFKSGAGFIIEPLTEIQNNARQIYNQNNPASMAEANREVTYANQIAEASIPLQQGISSLEKELAQNSDNYYQKKSLRGLGEFKKNIAAGIRNRDLSGFATNINDFAVRKLSNKELIDEANAIGELKKQTYSPDRNTLNGGVGTRLTESAFQDKVKETHRQGLNNSMVIARYEEKLENSIDGGNLDTKYLIKVDPKAEEIQNEVYVNGKNGDKFLVDKNSFISDNYMSELTSKLSETDKKSFSQAHIPNKFVGADGSGATKDSTFNNGVGSFVVTKTNNDGGSAIGSTTGPLTYFYNPKPSASMFTIGSDGSGKVVNNPGDNKTYPDAKLNQGDNAQFNGLVFVPKTKNGTELNSDVFVVSKDGKTIDKVATLEKLKKLRELGYEFDPNELGAFAQVQVIDKATSQWLSANGETAAESAIVDKMKGNIGSKLLIPISSPNGVNAVSRVYGSNYSIANITKSNPNAVELQKLVKYAQENYSPDQTKIKANKDKQVQIRTRNEAVKEWNTMVGTKKTGNFKNFDEYYKSKTGGKTTPKPKPDNNSPI